MTKIKFCGICSESGMAYVNQLCPDYHGVVFAPRSSRQVRLEDVKDLRPFLKECITPVGVFRDQSVGFIKKVAETGIIDMVQLHGGESEDFIREVRKVTGMPVIKAFTVSTSAEAEKAAETCADYVMYDSGAGTGKTFDWSILLDIERPYFLAGGLTPDNVGEAVKLLKPFAVDTSSGIETDHRKDVIKMRAFIGAVKAAERSYIS